MNGRLLFTFFLALNHSVFAQSTIEGTYISEFNGTNGSSKRTLTLNSNGTFLFHTYEFHDRGIPQERNFYGKGSWTSENNVIYFMSPQSDIDDKFTLDFSNTKAKFDSKSPRDKSNRDIKTSLRFYESKVFWFKGMMLLKSE